MYRFISLRNAGDSTSKLMTRAFFLLFFSSGWEMSLFPGIFCTISVLSLYGEYVVRFFLPNGVFLLFDHGLDFLRQLI